MPVVVLAIFRVPLFVTLLLLAIEPLPDNEIDAPEETKVVPLKLLTPVKVWEPPETVSPPVPLTTPL